MIDTDKYEGHTEGPWTLYHRAGGKPTIAGKLSEVDWELIADAPLLLAEVKRLQYRYDMAVEQLQNTRKWIRKHQKILKEISHQAAHVSCSALDIEEWIEDVKL